VSKIIQSQKLYNQKLTSVLEHAGRWLLSSGIQEPSGGVARYYRSDLGKNAPVSTEITGYAVSAFLFLHSATGEECYLNAGVRAANYLTDVAWDSAGSTFPFEPGSNRAYFFDIGIIVRGLLAAWRATGNQRFRERARDGALSLAFDFMGDGEFHPVIALPEKQPLDYEPRWSRMPGCYQLKAALAWREISDTCKEEHAARLFESALVSALKTHDSFLPGESDPEKVMDRLHAYCYFLEALLWVADRDSVRSALAPSVAKTAALLREIAPRFERSDVSAQLLRVRLIAHHLGALPLDERSACEEADRAASFQIPEVGGFWFGRRGGEITPFVNPVSTSFAMQALALWQDHRAGRWNFQLPQLI
jgi:hypothetical protein